MSGLVFSQIPSATGFNYKSQVYELDTLSINTGNSDFGVSYLSEDQVVFSSPQRDKFFLRRWLENKQGYLELYKGDVTTTGSVENVEVFTDVLNSRYHESNISMTKDGKTVYFTSDNQLSGKRVKDSLGYTNLQLYKADIVDGVYQNVRLLPFNDTNYSTGHPVLSSDEQTLYFVSDMPGGFGQTDLYKVSIKEGDSYGEVINLGERVNSTGKEMFPFLDYDGVLYFSSDRSESVGGLDVFAISLIDSSDSLYHLPSPINSEQDDFSFVLSTKRQGFLSSNRLGGEGDDDVYKLHLSKCYQKVSGVVYNKKTHAPLSNAQVYIYKGSEVLETLTSDASGKYEGAVYLDCASSYEVKGVKETYKKDNAMFLTNDARVSNHEVDLELDPNACVQYVSGYVVNAKTNKAMSNAQVKIYNAGNDLIEELVTDAKGYYQSTLELSCSSNYLVTAIEKDYKEGKQVFSTTTSLSYQHKVDLRLIPYFVDDKIYIEPIYFDLDKSYIRPDAAKILDGVVATMQKYPTLIVEGGSHTDSRGNDSYNARLSARRAKATVDYIISKGISSDRISSKGYGETQLVNRCKNGVRCSKAEHQLNRRTEFKILKK